MFVKMEASLVVTVFDTVYLLRLYYLELEHRPYITKSFLIIYSLRILYE